ncbi:MAG: hypothetical protein AB7D46_06270 [Flavobacteriaceae bacterium]
MKKPLLLLFSILCFIGCKEQSEKQEQDSPKQSNQKEQTEVIVSSDTDDINAENPPTEEKKQRYHQGTTGDFNVRGNAQLIASWTASDQSKASGKIDSDNEIFITVHQNFINITKTYKNKATKLESIYDEYLPDSPYKVAVYAYDFDKDKRKEIVVISSAESGITSVKVFRYIEDFTELVGHFDAQYDVDFEDNTIVFPYGGQGLYSEYLYKDNRFYELKYHSPQKE